MNRREVQVRWQRAISEENGPAPDFVTAAIQKGPDAFETYVEEPHRGGWWGRLVTSESDYFVKGRRPLSFRRRLASILLPRGLESEWQALLWFQAQGLATAEPVALGEYRRLGMLQLSVLVTRWVPDSSTVEQAISAMDGEGRCRLIERAGAYLGGLFCDGVLHRQPHGRNLLLTSKEMIAIDLKHAWISTTFTDEDFLWWLDQVSYWFRPPNIDWENPEEARALYQAALSAAAPKIRDLQRANAYVDGLVGRGRMTVKLHRQEWRPAD